MSYCRCPRTGGFSIIELVVVISIIAILVSIAVPSYIKYTEKSRVSSYALPVLRGCMADIASYCASNSPPSGTEDYGNPVGNARFPNCKANIPTPVGTVTILALENPVCSSSGLLIQGRLTASLPSGGYKAYCTVDVRPFRCYIE